ncbi:MAG TPA: molybdate ABC transporter substrate-binding protein [Longimicrobiales bacterium]
MRAPRPIPLAHVIRACALLCCLTLPWTAPAWARQADETVLVAVAANFAETQAALAARFTAATGVVVRASIGSTGQLYAQIRNGAPFDVFLAADEERPRRLEAEGRVVPGTRFTYAEGRLVLYGPGLDSVRAGGADLIEGEYAHLAIANPETAPYGVAAVQTLERLGLADAVAARLIRGESIGQTYRFVRSGAAELGFVALSQVRGESSCRYWIVPRELHGPIRQDAVLLRHGADNAGARRYVAYLRSPEARRLIASYGYGTGRR